MCGPGTTLVHTHTYMSWGNEAQASVMSCWCWCCYLRPSAVTTVQWAPEVGLAGSPEVGRRERQAMSLETQGGKENCS